MLAFQHFPIPLKEDAVDPAEEDSVQNTACFLWGKFWIVFGECSLLSMAFKNEEKSLETALDTDEDLQVPEMKCTYLESQ